jgi:predicted porin
MQHWDDLDGYVLLTTYMWDKDNTIGANWVWAHSDGNCPSFGTGINVGDLNFHNVGLHGNGSIAGLTYGAEVDMQFGKLKDVLFSGENLKAKGWAAFAKLGYALDMVNLRASFAYGSGDDNGNDWDCDEFQTLQGSDYGATARLVHYTQIYERTVRTAAYEAALTTTVGGNTTNTGIANTTYFNLGVDVNPMKELSLSLDGYYLMASQTGAWEDDLGVSVDKNLGWEIDTKINYKIAKNLSYFVEAGWFKPDDFYTDIGAEDKTVTQLVHGISLTF